MKVPTVFCIGVLACILAPAAAVFACSCSAPATAGDALQRSSEVFRGRVTKLSRSFMDSAGLTASGRHFVEFEVIRRWKGVESGRSVVYTPLTGEACGFPFEVGKEYLVYVVPENNVAPTGICTGTKPVADAAAEMQKLDEINK